MKKIRSTLCFSIILLSTLLTACGVADTTQPQATQESAQQGVTVTPTLMKKFIFDTQVAVDLATEQVQTAPPLPPATFPPSPTLGADRLGTDQDCGLLREFIPQNCWKSDSRRMGVQAGYRIEDDAQGAIQVITDQMVIYSTPQRVGAVELKSVNYPYAVVFTGTLEFTFNLDTRRWVTGGSGTILFVVGSTTLTPADAAIKARLEAKGYNVLVKSATSSQTSDANGTILVIISSTVTSSNVNTKFRDVAVPVITWDMALYDDMLMTNVGVPNEQGTTEAVTTLNIVSDYYALTADLVGTRSIATSGVQMDYGNPNANAVVIARAGGGNRAVIFAYDSCATLINNTTKAPARRVGLFMNDTTAANLTTDGWTLVDASVTWAIASRPCINGATATPTPFGGSPPTPTSTGATNTPTRTPTPAPATATATRTPTATPSGTKTALFVVSNATSLNAGDTAVKTRLEGLGYSVTLKTATASATSDATGKTLVLISSSVASTDVNTKFKSVTVPVIVWEYALYDDMAMTSTTSGTDYGYNTGTSMVITNAGHPLAAGLSGTVSLYSSATNIPFGVTSVNAISVGAVSSTSTRKLEFAYDKNAAMVGGFTVNARRVGIFLVDTATPTTDAWTLFDAAVTWATAP